MERWLSLTVRKVALPTKNLPKSRVYISVPKRLVKKAVARNRIKRVFREVVRLDSYFLGEKVYFLKVLSLPEKVNFFSAKEAVSALHG